MLCAPKSHACQPTCHFISTMFSLSTEYLAIPFVTLYHHTIGIILLNGFFSSKPFINLTSKLPPTPGAAWSLPLLLPFKWFIFVNSISLFLLCWNGYSQSLKYLFDYISGLLVILIILIFFIFSIVFDNASIKMHFQVFAISPVSCGVSP